MRNLLTSFLVIIFLSGCTPAIPTSKDLSHGLIVKQYDIKFRQYLPQPTSVRLVSLGNGDDYLEIGIGSSVPDPATGSLIRVVRFLPRYIDTYLKMIDAYLSLESSAVSNKRMEDRTLGKIEGHGEDIMFALFSGTSDRHYLALGLSPYDQHYDLKNALVLKELLIKYQHRELLR